MHKNLLISIAVCVVLALAPYVALFVMHGGPYMVPPEFMDDSNYYYARMQEVVDGHPFIGNPYLKEHAGEVASAFFGADWIAATPLFFTRDLMPAILINVVVWSGLYVVLLYWLFGLLNLHQRVRVGAVIVTFVASFWYMERPVAMQIVYPAFVLLLGSILLWLKEPASRKAQVLLVVSAGISFYLYTYLWQITMVAGALLNMYVLLRNRASFRTLLGIDIGIVLVALPMGMYMVVQLSHPWYWETVRRIGFVATHTFGLAGVFAGLMLGAAIGAALLVRKYVDIPTKIFFTIITGALVITTFSNVLTGKDLETAVHIGRFVDLWVVVVAIVVVTYVLPRMRRLTQLDMLSGGIAVALLLWVIVPMCVHGLRTMKEPLAYERYAQVLAWIQQNAPEGSVIFADDKLSYYIPALTHAYVLFQPNAGLYLVPDTEMQERYLLSRSLSNLTEDDIKRDLRLYAGVGNAVHGYKIHNREARMCMLLRLGGCAPLIPDNTNYMGSAYFYGLYTHVARIASKRESLFVDYEVDYVINDKIRNNYDMSRLRNAHLIARVGEFEIYALSSH